MNSAAFAPLTNAAMNWNDFFPSAVSAAEGVSFARFPDKMCAAA